jgi:hypothetical protein
MILQRRYFGTLAQAVLNFGQQQFVCMVFVGG